MSASTTTAVAIGVLVIGGIALLRRADVRLVLAAERPARRVGDGPTGAGRSGAAFTIVTRHDQKHADAIEKLIGEKVEWLNGDLSALPPPEPSRDDDRSRRKGRDKDTGRGKSRRGHKSEIAVADNDVETMETAAPAKVESVKQERKAEQNKPQQSSRAARPYPANDDNRDRRRYRDHDDGPTPVGFGDEIPAFMLITANAKI